MHFWIVKRKMTCGFFAQVIFCKVCEKRNSQVWERSRFSVEKDDCLFEKRKDFFLEICTVLYKANKNYCEI